MNNMPILEARGWKEVCALLRVKHRYTAKAILERTGIPYLDGKQPCVNIESYRKASLQRHLIKKK